MKQIRSRHHVQMGHVCQSIFNMSNISAFVLSRTRSFTQIHECVYFLSTVIRNDINDLAFRICS